jgi:hypothetical protein
MADLSFRQQAAQQAATRLKTQRQQDDLRRPLTATIGTMSIALRACIGRPCYIGPDGVERQSAADQLVIVLAMSNLGGASPILYHGLASGNSEPGDAAGAVLSDDMGNQYSRAATSRGLEHWVGQVSGSRSVGPGDTLADVLVFGAPNPRATKFTLELPRANWGATGTLRLDLPVARIANYPIRAT